MADLDPSTEPSPPEKDFPQGQAQTPAPLQTPTSGRRQAFDDVMRPLTPDDLTSPGTQKIILFMLQQTQSENETLDGYVERFHDADKRAAILQQQLDHERKLSRATELATIVGTTLGGAILGVALYFFGKQQTDNVAGIIALAFGLLLIGGAYAVKAARR